MSRKMQENEETTGEGGDLKLVGLSDKLYKIRNYLGLRLGEILVKINPDETNGHNRSRISEYERGNREPSLVEILNYAKLVGISIETLFDSQLKLPAEIDERPEHPRCRKRRLCRQPKKQKTASTAMPEEGIVRD